MSKMATCKTIRFFIFPDPPVLHNGFGAAGRIKSATYGAQRRSLILSHIYAKVLV